MKRRDFLKTPGLSVLVPTALGIEMLPRSLAFAAPEGQIANAQFPQNLHPDFVTYHEGIEYFLLGNGDIQAVVQYSPRQNVEKPQSFLGLTLMSSEHFARKWSSYLFHPEIGFGRTMANVVLDGEQFTSTKESFQSIGWEYPEGIPTVVLRWSAGDVEIEEEFFVPAKGGILFRSITAKNNGGVAIPLTVNLALVPNFALFDDIFTEGRAVNGHGFSRVRLMTNEKNVTTSFRYYMSVDKGTLEAPKSLRARFTYSIDGDEQKLPKSFSLTQKKTSEYWSGKTRVESGNESLDHLFNISKSGLKANIAWSGKRDSGIWMYNMEWVRDDSMVVSGLVKAGFFAEAKTILTKMLEKSVGEDGRTIESSRWFGHDYTELDQNGELLYVVWVYLCWTGDEKFVRKYWSKLRLVADFPLQDIFWNKTAGLLRNKREYWERNDSFGFTDGFEMVYQFWVILGLEKIVEVAELLGDRKPIARWRDAAGKLKSAMLENPKYRFIEDGHFIKRRSLNGDWQRYVVPPNRRSMPPDSPLATEEKPSCDPDAAVVQPIVYGMIDPSSELSKKTLDWVESLWNQRWTTGGYSRYDVSSEPDPPAPWPIASLFLARAYAETGNSEKVWRVLNWLTSVNGGKSGGFFERYGPSITPPAPPVGVVGWAWAEIASLVVENIMGVRPGLDSLVIRPNLLDGVNEMKTRFSVRGVAVTLSLKKAAGEPSVRVNNNPGIIKDGAFTMKYPSGGSLTIEMNI